MNRKKSWLVAGAAVACVAGVSVATVGGGARCDDVASGGTIAARDANDVVHCKTLDNADKQTVQRRLGSPAEQLRESVGKETWDYDLGPGSGTVPCHLIVEFGRDNRVSRVSTTNSC